MADIRSLTDHIFLAVLDQNRDGFREFLSSWVIRDGNTAAIVDPGPVLTIPILVKALAELGINHIQTILLTHIHLDHAGGAGRLLHHFPDAAVVCHPEGIPHLAKPERLWKASLRTLGDVAEQYGRPDPVPEARMSFPDRIALGPFAIECLQAPGHAPHHAAYLMASVLFSGDAAGVSYPLQEGIHLRLAAGPGFNCDDYTRSLDTLVTLQPPHLCFGHFGWTERPGDYFDVHAAQVRLWISIIREHLGWEKVPDDHIFEELLAKDPGLTNFALLPGDIRKREKHFIFNSIRGLTHCMAES